MEHAFDIRFYIPFFSILIPMIFAIVSPLIKKKKVCRVVSLWIYGAIALMSISLIMYLSTVDGNYFVFMAGHFPAPWGNELRAGYLEAAMALTFSLMMFLAIWGGKQNTDDLISDKRGYLHYIMLNFLLASVLALVYTNDAFTAYVFVEINTAAAVGLIFISEMPKAMAAAMKYLFMSMIGSGLFLFGICYLYAITGHLLMSPLKESIAVLVQTGQYRVPLTISFGMIAVGLCLKSGLFPFHAWYPDAYYYAPDSSSALLSGVVSKAYIITLIKFVYRVYGTETFAAMHISTIVLVLGCIAMLLGSVYAFMQKDIKKMVSFSSVAQIGYIFVGIGLNSQLGYAAAAFHIIFHAFTKGMLFIATGNLTKKSGKTKIEDMRGMGYKCPVSAMAFWVGGLSMIGIPLFMGFISKLNFANAAFGMHQFYILFILSLSTCLNVLYFVPVMTILYSKRGLTNEETTREYEGWNISLPLIGFMAINIILGLFQSPVMNMIITGLNTLG